MSILTEPGAALPIPFARFAYVQERWDAGMPDLVLYRITGGKWDGSDVTAKTLREIGIPVPEGTEAAS